MFVVPDGYELDRVIGAGSVFQVATVSSQGAIVVCKRLTPRMAGEVTALAALERERGFLELVRHRCVPTLIATGEDGGGPFLLESVAPGVPLARMAERGPLPAAVLSGVATAAFEALAEVHAFGAAVGDLSPDDVFVGKRRGELTFVDFGQSSWDEMPAAPEARGTLPYTPPEVARGEAPWSRSADVYALAAIVLHASLGRAPTDLGGAGLLAEVAEQGIAARFIDEAPLDEAWRRALKETLHFERRLADANAVLALVR